MEGQAVNPIASFLPLILIFVVFYFLLIQPQRKQKKQHEQMIKNLGKNDEVVTSGGLFGTVTNVRPEAITLRIDEHVRVDIEPSAIVRLVKPKGSSAEPVLVEKRGA